MDFALSPEQEALRDSVRGFARRTLADRALERAHDPSYPWDLAAALGKQSLLGLALPEAHGGGGAALLDAVLVMEELATVCPTSADVFQAGNFGAIRTLSEYAGEKLRDRILPPLLDGTGLIALGMSEPEAGLGRHRPSHYGARRGRPVRGERDQDVVDQQHGRDRVPGVRTVRPWSQGHRVGHRGT